MWNRKRRVYVICFMFLAVGLMLCGCQSGKEEQVQTQEEPQREDMPSMLVDQTMDIYVLQENDEAASGVMAKSIVSGVSQCASKFRISYMSGSTAEIVKGKTQLIIWSGEDAKEKVQETSTRYPDTHFLWVDADPEKQQVTLQENTAAISFRREQGGYLAGYGAALNDQRIVGFIGLEEDWNSRQYYYGFYQGLNDGAAYMAARSEVSAPEAYVELHCAEVSADVTKEEVAVLLEQWQTAGVQTIMVGTPELQISLEDGTVVELKQLCADESNARGMQMIAVEWRNLSRENIVASVMVDATQAVYDMCCSHVEEEWKGGEAYVYDISTDSIELEFAKSDYGVFTREDLRNLTERLIDGTIKVNGDITVPLEAADFPYVTSYTE